MPPASTRVRRWPAVVWLLCIAVAAVISVRSRYVADLSAFLPSSPTAEQAVLLDQVKSGAASRLVLIGIEGGTTETRSAASLAWARTLRGHGAFESVHNGDNAAYEAFGRFLFDHRYLLSPAVDAERFTAAGLAAAIDDTVSLLGTPAGALIKPVILRDPTGETVRMAEALLPRSGPRSAGGVWVSRSAARAVLIATTRVGGADLDGLEAALSSLQTSFAPFAAQGLRLVVSGAPSFAVASRSQIKAEVERLAIAGSVAIVALLVLAFGSARSLGIALLPVASGVLAGIAAVSLGFGNVHGITLGFGTTLIGEAVDYAIYYLIQARPPAGDSRAGAGAVRWLKNSWPTVRLGLWTSLCGFAALMFSGFPGLAQLGLFSVAGLTAAALTTRYVFPVLAPNGAPGRGLRRRLGGVTAVVVAALPRFRMLLWTLIAVSVAALFWLPSPWRGDLQSLSPVDAASMRIDTELRADVGAAEPGTLVALSAADETSVLALAEAAGQRLDRLVASGALAGYDTPARLLPSIATQTARQAALPDAAELRARLADATRDGALPAERLAAFIDDVQAARSQPHLTRASLRNTPLATPLDALLIAGEPGRPWRALVGLQGGERGLDDAALRDALDGLPGAQVVHIGAELASLYSRYLRQAGLQALLGALAVCALLGLHLRSWRRLVDIARPVAAAVLVVLAVLAASGTALGVLHLVGFLLVVAIGSNYALFFDQLRFDRLRHARLRVDQPSVDRPGVDPSQPAGDALDADTLASLALANLTAVLSFSLLALSGIPVLRAIGVVVAPGALLCLLLSAAFIPVVRFPKAMGK